MKKMCIALVLVLLPLSSAQANCDLTRFRWGCDIPLHIKRNQGSSARIYCGSTYGYVSQAEYETIARYQRVNVNMVLKINGEYLDSPCLPGERFAESR